MTSEVKAQTREAQVPKAPAQVEKKEMTVAFIGNPNCGKTTLFNAYTGANLKVANWPGVTVEKVEGAINAHGYHIHLVDLPGTYSLTSYTMEEQVSRNFILSDDVDVIVDVIDASALERNLYLTLQLLELGKPVVVALNMMDIVEKRGMEIDLHRLPEMLGVPVIPVSALKRRGLSVLLHAAVHHKDHVHPDRLIHNHSDQTNHQHNHHSEFAMVYSDEMEDRIDAVRHLLHDKYPDLYNHRWHALKLLEKDPEIAAKYPVDDVHHVLDRSYETDIITEKYAFIEEIIHEVVVNQASKAAATDSVDRYLTDKWLGIPIFLGLMWLMFVVVINVGAYPQGWLDTGFSMLGDWCSDVIEDDQLRSLVVDGVIGGVGSVLSFVPLIVLLYLFISLLEDTGYMARAAFLIDRAMRALGLHGKSFIPMILGFGCNVPGIMAARTLDNEKDRLVTILACPFMSCGARLPVYTLLIAAFFGASGHGGTVLFGIYLLGIVISICVALVLRHTTFKGEQEPFVMEMPPYHIPTLKGVLMHMWERTVLYLKKAGTFILGASVLVWFLTAYPVDVDYSQDFDAAKDQVTAEMEQKQSDILQSYGLSAIEDNDALNEMYESMVAAADEAADEADENEADTGNALNPAAALSSVEDQVKDSENAEDNLFMGKYPQSFANLQEQNPAVFAQALPLFDAKADADDETSKLEDQQNAEKLEQSYAARLGHFVEPVIAPLGFDWKIGVGLIACTAAKEVMVSTLGTIYSVGGDDTHESGLVAYLRDDPDFNQAVALSLMVFVLLYMPCVAAMAVIKRETGSWKMLLASNGMCLVLSYVLAFVTYHLALMAGLGA